MNCINTFFESALHLLYPHVCAGCGSDLVLQGDVICVNCISQLPVTNFHRHADNAVERVFWGRLPLVMATSFVYFNKGSIVQQLLHQLKYKGNKEVGLFFGRRIGETLAESGRLGNVDALVPLPLHPKKEKSRGFNQAAIICEGMGTVMKLPVFDRVVGRTIITDTQTKKNRMDRWQNTVGRFQVIDEGAIRDKHLLLVDDVITTGATLEACGGQLLKGGNVRLSIASLAYTTL
jgi:ComF family protein